MREIGPSIEETCIGSVINSSGKFLPWRGLIKIPGKSDPGGCSCGKECCCYLQETWFFGVLSDMLRLLRAANKAVETSRADVEKWSATDCGEANAVFERKNGGRQGAEGGCNRVIWRPAKRGGRPAIQHRTSRLGWSQQQQVAGGELSKSANPCIPRVFCRPPCEVSRQFGDVRSHTRSGTSPE